MYVPLDLDAPLSSQIDLGCTESALRKLMHILSANNTMDPCYDGQSFLLCSQRQFTAVYSCMQHTGTAIIPGMTPSTMAITFLARSGQ